jgi:hypothetical protein
MDNAFARLNVPHFFRWVLLNLAVFFAFCAFLVPGVIWTTNIMKKTGYRPIDWLIILFVPFGGWFVGTRTQWRYCATTKYWEPAAPVVPSSNLDSTLVGV